MASPKTVLIVDDNLVNRSVLRKLLSRDYDVLEAGDGQRALEILSERAKTIAGIMLDLVMPVMDGYAFLREISKVEAYRSIPIIVTTGSSDQKSEIRALELGAWDFVSKPYNATILRFRLKNAIERSMLSAFEQMRYLAEHDTLTGLYNRGKFLEATRTMLDEHPDTIFVYIRFDIENFKLINSFFGTAEGDKLLRRIGHRLQDFTHHCPVMTSCRMNADVFCICLPYPGREKLVENLEKVREELHHYRDDFELMPCFGLYVVDDPAASVDTMYDHAVVASRRCKGSYIKYWEFYEKSMGNNIEQEQMIVNTMATALEQHQFCLYFQPKYDVRTNKPAGAEALVRWIHPEKGMISPGAFIPVFERNGFISKLDWYVWDQACGILARWAREGRPETPISVNVSRVNLYNPNLPAIMKALVDKHNIPARLLNLEITESAYTENTHIIRQSIDQLRQMGFVIMMDDFGSGYSSLNVLKDVYMDILKVDMKFLPTEHDGRAERILASVIRMAKWLEMPVIVEGVETEAQAVLVESLGCDYIQGYYFARPMPLEDYERLMAAQTPVAAEDEAEQDNLLNILNHIAPESDVFFRSVSQPIVMFSCKHGDVTVLQVNQAYKELLGIDSSKAQTMPNMLDEETRSAIRQGALTVAENHDITEIDYTRLDAAGQPMWLHMRIQYLSDIGESKIVVGILTNVSPSHEVEAKLASLQRQQAALRAKEKYLLLVDDQELSRVMLAETFCDRFEPLEASGGEEALRLMHAYKGQIAAVLLDMMMPDMNGSEVLSRKMADPEISQIPVVVISADGEMDVQLDALAHGVSDYVTKPFVPEVARQRVFNAIESARQKRLSNEM